MTGASLEAGRGSRLCGPFGRHRRWTLGLTILPLIWGCAAGGPPTSGKRHIVETELGPIVVEVNGFAGGLTNAGVTRLVDAGLQQGCATPLPDGVRRTVGKSTAIVWNVAPAATPHASTMVTARLLKDGKPVGFAYDRTTSPSGEPPAVFKRIVAQLACSLLREAGDPDRSSR